MLDVRKNFTEDLWNIPSRHILLKVNNGNTRTMCENCSRLFIMATLNIFYTLFWCFHCCHWTCTLDIGHDRLGSYSDNTRNILHKIIVLQFSLIELKSRQPANFKRNLQWLYPWYFSIFFRTNLNACFCKVTKLSLKDLAQWTYTCSKLTIKTVKQLDRYSSVYRSVYSDFKLQVFAQCKKDIKMKN